MEEWRKRRKRPLRRYGSRPATVQVERDSRVKVVVDRPAVAAAIGQLGWRVYATDQAELSLTEAVAVRPSPWPVMVLSAGLSYWYFKRRGWL